MGKDDWKSIAWIATADIVIVLVIGFLAWKVSLWALLGLFFLLSSKDKIEITLKDGTKIEATGSDAIEKAEEMKEKVEGKCGME